MPNALNKENLFFQNLIDAGCNPQLTEKCMRYYHSGLFENILQTLSLYRRDVLLETRKKQKQIDCIDFLTNKIKRNEY